MHFSIEQVLWALILAAHLTLLIVLMGRERISRFRWFTAYIALSAVSLVANHLLHGKLTTVAFYWQNYSLLALQSIVGLFMLNELARQTFPVGQPRPSALSARTVPTNIYVGWAAILAALTAAAVWAWGPWPSMQALEANPAQLRLLIVILIGMKGQLSVMILTVLVALMMRILGGRFGSSWRSHPQQIALGLSTSALAFLAVQAINDAMSRTFHPKTKPEYEHAVHMLTRIENGRTVVWTLSLIWILYWLWREDPGAPAAAEPAAVPVAAGPVLLEGSAANPLPIEEDLA